MSAPAIYIHADDENIRPDSPDNSLADDPVIPKRRQQKLDPMNTINECDRGDRLIELKDYADKHLVRVRDFSPTTIKLLTTISRSCDLLLMERNVENDDKEDLLAQVLASEHALYNKEALQGYKFSETTTVCGLFQKALQATFLFELGDNFGLVVDLAKEIINTNELTNKPLIDKEKIS